MKFKSAIIKDFKRFKHLTDHAFAPGGYVDRDSPATFVRFG